MKVSSSKENILKKIRQALSHPVPVPFPTSEGNTSVYKPLNQDADVEFAEKFTELQGKFIYCANTLELASQLNDLSGHMQWQKVFCIEDDLKKMLASQGFNNFFYPDIATCDFSITGCECLVARTGTIVMSAGQQSGRTTSVYAPVHVCIAFTDQLVNDIKDALQLIKEKYQGKIPSLITFASGPSRTADIEKTLVVGVHGPKEVYCFLVEK